MPEHMRFAFYALAVRTAVYTLKMQIEAKATGRIQAPYEEM